MLFISRIDDEFFDPLVFKAEQYFGRARHYECIPQRQCSIVNAMGNGVADDKAVYAYVPAYDKILFE